jgi:hypothetical protein
MQSDPGVTDQRRGLGNRGLRRSRVLVQTNAAVDVAGSAFDLALYGSGFLALAFLRGLFVKLAAAKFRQNAGLFTGTLEAPQGGIEILVFSDTYAWQNSILLDHSRATGRAWGEKTGAKAGRGRKYTVRPEELQSPETVFSSRFEA